ncbi:Casein kinase II subunit beta-1 [Zea mays]|nr:Casein kinase II subunit beta-1 [Zea mays]
MVRLLFLKEVDAYWFAFEFMVCNLFSIYLSFSAFITYDTYTEERKEFIELSAEILYGLIHARYILTSKGLAAMLEKFKNRDFGGCPRVYCCGQPCLPAGQSDVPRSSTVKIYCPKCEELNYPISMYQGSIDGSYFGTTFPHLFLMTYPHLKPQKPPQQYTPRVFGFKHHKPS